MINFFVFAFIVSIPLIVPLFSYSAMCGLTLESIIYEKNRDINILKMSEAITESTMDQSASVSDHELSVELNEKSESEAESSEKSQDEATLLEEESEEQEALAAKDEEMSDTLFEKGSEEQEEVAESTTKATKAEGFFETDMEEANSEAAEAATNEAEGEGSGIATLICNFIPFVDILCDAVGAAAEVRKTKETSYFVAKLCHFLCVLISKMFFLQVGSKSSEAMNTATSVASYTAAVTAKAQEDADLASAASFEAQADVDAASATKYQEKATNEEELAEEEKTEAEVDEAKSKGDLAQSEKDEADSAEKETQSEAEELESGEAFERAMNYGLDATVDALLSIFSSLPVLFFFSSKVVRKAASPMVTHVHRQLKTHGFHRGAMAISSSIKMNTIRTIIHGLLFFWIINVQNQLNHTWDTWNNYSIRQKGGVIIIFATLAGVLNTMIFIYLDNQELVGKIYFITDDSNFERECEQNTESLRNHKHLGFQIVSKMCFFIPLIIIEALILAIVSGGFGQGEKGRVTSISGWYAFAGISLPIIILILLHTSKEDGNDFESISIVEVSEEENIVKEIIQTKNVSLEYSTSHELSNEKNLKSKEHIDEETGLLSKEKSASIEHGIVYIPFNDYNLLQEIKKNMIALELPFSILLLTIVVTILHRHAIVTLSGLMPVFEYGINELATIAGSIAGAYIIIIFGSILCISVIICWTKIVHRQSSSSNGMA